MGKVKPIEDRIPWIYRKKTIDQMLFSYVTGVRDAHGRITIEQAILMFMEKYNLSEDDFPVESAMVSYQRMHRDFVHMSGGFAETVVDND